MLDKGNSEYDAPVLRPSVEEFVHPIKYLCRPEIERLGKQFGIVKVVPPTGWTPRFSLEWKEFKFHTRIQRLAELNLRNRSRACFVEGFNCYLASCGEDPVPVVDNLCLGVADGYKRSEEDLEIHLNGWFGLRSGGGVHMHDIFRSREYRKWFHRITDTEEDRMLLKRLSKYGRFLVDALKLDDEGLGSEIPHNTLKDLLKSPDALLRRPENEMKLQKMKKRMKTVDKAALEGLDETCTVCYKRDSPSTTLICDGCSEGFHMKCLPIPLERVPKYDWFCTRCLVGKTGGYSEYGFEEEFENKFSLGEFENYCRTWEIQLINMIRGTKIRGKSVELSEEEVRTYRLSEKNVEKLFWQFTNGETALPREMDSMKIRYGADIHNEVAGEVSGFPLADNPRLTESDKGYVDDEWNLNNLPFAKGSLLRYICDSIGNGGKNEISGMTVPWVYVGGPFSTFCWHKEDHYTMSANYSHLGAPKKWYGIPANNSFEFEQIISNIAPEYEAKERDLMHQLVSMVSPEEIRRDGKVKVFETIQRAGEFIITFPKVYHSGFNYGFNVNEAVNFTSPFWVPYSVGAVEEYVGVGKECVFDTFKLLKKVNEELSCAEGRKKWMIESGVNEEKVDELREWSGKEYMKEVNKFGNIVKSEEVIKILRNVKRVNEMDMEDWNKEGMEEGMREDMEEDMDMDDRLCIDCKTRVHFEWILVDMYEGWTKRKKTVDVKSKKRVKSKVISIVIDDAKYQDVESEWEDIIRKAREESVDSDNSNRARRSKRGRNEIESEIERVEEEDIETNRFFGAMEVMRGDNNMFGKCVLCVKCFRDEIRNLNESERKEVCEVSCVVVESM